MSVQYAFLVLATLCQSTLGGQFFPQSLQIEDHLLPTNGVAVPFAVSVMAFPTTQQLSTWGVKVAPEDMGQAPVIQIPNMKPGHSYTVIMVNPDHIGGFYSPGQKPLRWYYAKQHITTASSATSGDVLVPYTPPNPTIEEEWQRVVVLVFDEAGAGGAVTPYTLSEFQSSIASFQMPNGVEQFADKFFYDNGGSFNSNQPVAGTFVWTQKTQECNLSCLIGQYWLFSYFFGSG